MEDSFAYAEASMRLEGMDPTRHPEYVEQRDRIIAGTLTVEEAIAETRERHAAVARKSHEFAHSA